MRFLCQVWFESAEIAKISEEEGRKLTQDSIDNDNRLRESGHIIVANALYEPQEARTVRVRKGEAAVTDGPFAEMKEHLGGFVLIEAKDMQEATEIAATFPVARYGMIEVRAAYDIRFPDQ
ncbi:MULTISPECIES: YciI family protein [unclassified Rhizobium]|uniref:YciI family protein n=1 Tax=unclassified Rhizobium TaxID=2613769 RepID=UPI0018EA4ACA